MPSRLTCFTLAVPWLSPSFQFSFVRKLVEKPTARDCNRQGGSKVIKFNLFIFNVVRRRLSDKYLRSVHTFSASVHMYTM